MLLQKTQRKEKKFFKDIINRNKSTIDNNRKPQNKSK